jgi:hypothetical protein
MTPPSNKSLKVLPRLHVLPGAHHTPVEGDVKQKVVSVLKSGTATLGAY